MLKRYPVSFYLILLLVTVGAPAAGGHILKLLKKSGSRADTWVHPYSWYISYAHTSIYGAHVGRGFPLAPH